MKNISRRNFIFALLMGILALAATESMLQLILYILPRANNFLATTYLRDDRLGMRLNPDFPGHDKNGFRNSVVLPHYDIVAMGDSQTYGSGVRAEESWPKVLEKISGFKTYNMACAGYGPAHYLFLFKNALRFNPRYIIIAFYLGNDVYESYSLIYKYQQLSELKNKDETVLRQIYETEQVNPIEKTLRRHIGKKEKDYLLRIREFFSRHCKIYGLLRSLKTAILKAVYKPKDYAWKTAVKLVNLEKPKNTRFIFNDGKCKTIFTPGYRLAVVDCDDPRIAEGFRICCESVRLMHEEANKHGIKLIVLLLPTKENVFKDVVGNSRCPIPEPYNLLIKKENDLGSRMSIFLKEGNISFVDSLPVLRKCLEDNIQPYPFSEDGHINAAGHKAVAKLMSEVVLIWQY